ncbi:response regulator transcription factor [Tahibacter sp.]|uniref:response regulator transcription factor n=1 Tax=Tahibacter sp. TaxID=2056211 RepID=UPI0028C38042|nr:response regulator transcription factor [Tahibacter sp.]
MHILVVEDNLALRSSLAETLQAQGHRADFAADGRSGLQLALAEPPDVLVLDLNLPGMDGLNVCRHLRERADRHIPVLMLTARDSLDDKLDGFAAGADDYLVKPFAGKELIARCLALSQRHRVGATHELRIGSLTIDRRRNEARRHGVLLELQQTPYRILLALAEAWPRTLTRSELVQRLWGDEAPLSDPLRTHLYLLRQALDKPFDRPLLKTVHGVGFKLDSDA